jgi:hypothetical protein
LVLLKIRKKKKKGRIMVEVRIVVEIKERECVFEGVMGRMENWD